jgi:outer membrane lipoprotein-sorting protein
VKLSYKLAWSLLACACAAAPAAAQTVDEIVAQHVAARGGMDKLKAVHSLRMTGKMMMGPGIEVPVTLELKRPRKMRMEMTFQGMTGIQAFDGSSGWQLMPFSGRKDPEPMSPDDVKEAEEQADIDGSLVDWKDKGHSVELIGKEPVEGADAYKLKVTLKSGDVRYVWLDAEYFLELRSEGKRMIRGSEMETETSYGDYKEVDGILFPFAIEGGAKGQPERQKVTVEKIELNPEIEDGRFVQPAAAPAAAPQG